MDNNAPPDNAPVRAPPEENNLPNAEPVPPPAASPEMIPDDPRAPTPTQEDFERAFRAATISLRNSGASNSFGPRPNNVTPVPEEPKETERPPQNVERPKSSSEEPVRGPVNQAAGSVSTRSVSPTAIRNDVLNNNPVGDAAPVHPAGLRAQPGVNPELQNLLMNQDYPIDDEYHEDSNSSAQSDEQSAPDSDALKTLQTAYARGSTSTEEKSRASSQRSLSPESDQEQRAQATEGQQQNQVAPQTEKTQAAPEAHEGRRRRNAANKRSDGRTSPIVPTRKSTRIKKDKEEDPVVEQELLANFTESVPQDRGVVVPVGLLRDPFFFADKSKERLTIQLKIAMEPNFDSLKRKYDADSEQMLKRCSLKAKQNAKIRFGKDYQAIIPDCDSKAAKQDYRDDIDKNVWKPPSPRAIRNAFLEIEQYRNDCFIMNLEHLTDIYYAMCHGLFWRAIWRQFNGHFPYERALEHLKKNNYYFGRALENVDECLKDLPQEMKPLCVSQVRRFQKLMLHKKKSLRKIQEKVMRNYHLGEVHNYLYQFRRFYKIREVQLPCNCNQPICWPVQYEPRYACWNCTKSLRTNPEQSPDISKLCLICQTYWTMLKTMRLAKNPVFWESEQFFIEQWNVKEAELGVKLSRDNLEQAIMADQEKRWINMDLTPEENEMLNQRDLRFVNRQSKAPLNAEEKRQKGIKIAEQLRPFKLPHVTICRCEITEKLSTMTFTKEEEQVYRRAIIFAGGNLEKAAKALNTEVDYVHQFMVVYHKNHRMWAGYPNNVLHQNIREETLVVPLFMPANLPEDDRSPDDHEETETAKINNRNAKKRRSGRKEEEETEPTFVDVNLESPGSNSNSQDSFAPPPISQYPSTSGT